MRKQENFHVQRSLKLHFFLAAGWGFAALAYIYDKGPTSVIVLNFSTATIFFLLAVRLCVKEQRKKKESEETQNDIDDTSL